ncbi:MAG: hypothetical protein E4G94_03860 [ANME-2 cluster archaeon]|nr:MAG: hypothetical protein E4G94_03860 [ANME-2 cluster archaeon]
MKRDLLNDENSVSISIGFILTFGITVIAFIMIMNSFYSMMGQAEHTVMREEFEILGNDISVQLTNVDTIVGNTSNAGSNTQEIRYDLSLPDKVAGQYYSIGFSNQSREIIFCSHEKSETTVKIPYATRTVDVASTTIYSAAGSHYLLYSPATNIIEVH